MPFLSKTRWLLILATAMVLPLAFASQSVASIFISKTPHSYLRITLNENRKPVRVEGIFPLRCDGGYGGTSSIDLEGSEIRRYRDGSFGYVYKSDRNIHVRKKLRARLVKGKVRGFFSYRDEFESRCWTGRGYFRSAVRFAASRRPLKLSTYTYRDSETTFTFTLTESGKPIRVEGRYPTRCESDGVVQEKYIGGFLPRDFKYFEDGSFEIGWPLADNHNSVLEGLRAKLVDGTVAASYWYRFRITIEPEEETSCYSGLSDQDPTVNFVAIKK